jgi:ferredoxin-NADP reductase/predicted pyridoxine 5'-phosphate oxidase superfamily flavin-nucleotide-binding protein
MGRAFADIAFTPSVKAAQTRYGSRQSNRAYEVSGDRQDELTEYEQEFIAQRDGFYQATVSETGWPYVQFRGGPPGFLKVIDRKTIGFADFRGNIQYLSVGNILADGRVALILMDHANQRRLKVWGRARVVHRAEDPGLLAALEISTYAARVERAIVISVEAFDWNCPQHITRRFTEAEIRESLAPIIAELEDLRGQVRTPASSRDPEPLGDGELRLVVTGVRILTPRVRAYELRTAGGEPLPEIEAGAHLTVPVHLANGVESTHHYSIASDPDDPTRWEIAVLREDDARGGSVFVHKHYGVGTSLACGVPRNGFQLHADRRPAVLIAGGIGISPLKAMAHVLKREDRRFTLHFAAHSSGEAPYLCELRREFPGAMRTHWSSLGRDARMDIDLIVRTAPAECVFYVCGPARMLAAMQAAAEKAELPEERVRFERFAPPQASADDHSFEVQLRRSGAVLPVPVGKSILEVLLEADVRPSYDCRTGTCGTCATRVLHGEADHRDLVLSKAERERDHLICTCVSRCVGDLLVLDM